LSNGIVARVGDKEVARTVAGHVRRTIELRSRPCAVAAAKRRREACKCGDDASGDIDLSDRAVAIVGNEDATCTVARCASRSKKSRVSSRPIGGAPRDRGTSKRGDNAGGENNSSNSLAVGVRDEEVASTVAGHIVRPHAIARLLRGASDRGDDTCGDDDSPNRAVALVSDEEVAHTIASHSYWVVEARGSSGAVAATRCSRGASDRGDDTCGDIDSSNRVVVRVGDEEVAGTVRGHTARVVELRRGPNAIAAPHALPSERGDSARGDDDLLNPVVGILSDEEVTYAVHSHPPRGEEPHSERGDGACGDIDLSNRIIAHVGDKEMAGAIRG